MTNEYDVELKLLHMANNVLTDAVKDLQIRVEKLEFGQGYIETPPDRTIPR